MKRANTQNTEAIEFDINLLNALSNAETAQEQEFILKTWINPIK